MDQNTSKKLYNISFISMVLVVILHAQNVSTRIHDFTPGAWNYYFQFFISLRIGRIAVPLFFMISGFFFFDGLNMKLANFKEKISKRIKTLVIPYLLVSLCVIFLFWILQSIPNTKNYFNNQPLHQLSMGKIIGIWLFFPLAYQLWFLRNLIVMVALSPIIYHFICKTRLLGIIVIGIFWLTFSNVLPYYILDTCFFFFLGAYLKIFKFNYINNLKVKINVFLLGAIWIMLIILSMHYKQFSFSILLLNISIIIGIAVIWRFLDNSKVASFFENPWLRNVMQFSFFIYLFHEPLLTILIKILFSIFKINDITSILTYITTPLLTILICITFGIVLKKYLPVVYSVLSGNRHSTKL